MSLPTGYLSPPAACKAIGCCRATLYVRIAEMKLDARKLGGKTVITAESVAAYLTSLPPATIGRKGAPDAA